jgi:methionyl-tRNA formyltransferase
MITGGSAPSRALAQAVHRVVPLSSLVVYAPRPRGRGARLKEGLRRVVGPEPYWALSLLTRPRREWRVLRLDRKKEREADAFFLRRFRDQAKAFPAGVPTIQVTDVNSEQVRRHLSNEQPDLILLFGIPILRPHILGIARRGVLNAHTAPLPAYRGTRVEFWQVLNGDLDNAGITIHVVDPGVDTGPLLFQRRVTVPPGTDRFMLRVYCLMAIMEEYGHVAREYLDDRLTPVPQDDPGVPAFRRRDVTFERMREYYRKLGYSV